MLQLRGVIDGVEHTVVLDRPETTLGRDEDNDLVLIDRVTSRHHAVVLHDGDRWWIRDLESRYGLRVNDDVADEVDLQVGDVVTIGTVDFTVEAATGGPAGTETFEVDARGRIDDPVEDPARGPAVGLVRPVADFAVSLGLSPTDEGTTPPEPVPDAVGSSDAVPGEPVDADHGYSSLAVGYLTRLAHDLRTAADVDEAARATFDVAFHALPVDRGWILFTDAGGDVIERIARIGDRVEHPAGELPISMSIVRRVLAERVSMATGDVTLDARAASRSMMAHHIRAAMCAPLWSGDAISGVIYVDSLLTRGTFTASALDLLTAMANNLAVAVSALHHAQDAERERQARRHLERYHSPAMIDALQRREAVEGTSKLRQADVTVLFADVVGFTSLSQELSPDGVARLLDGFFTEAVEAVFEHGGTLDKFIGDAVMAFFGAPVPTHDHAEQALRAALDLRFRLIRWNQRQIEAGGRPVEIRFALNSGPVVVGDVGSSRRVDYTVLGNTVNVAARLEGVGAPGEIVIGPGTRERLPADFPLEPLGEIELKGLRHPIPVWKVATRPA
mgnify:CR=1 FL=1